MPTTLLFKLPGVRTRANVQGYIVFSVEHADGTASAVRLAHGGGWLYYQGWGSEEGRMAQTRCCPLHTVCCLLHSLCCPVHSLCCPLHSLGIAYVARITCSIQMWEPMLETSINIPLMGTGLKPSSHKQSACGSVLAKT